MKSLRVTVLVGLAIAGLMAAADLSGNWEVDAVFDDGNTPGGSFDCAFTQEGEQLKGTCSGGTAAVTGEVKGQSITWRLAEGEATATPTFIGTLNDAGNGMKGRFTIADRRGAFTAEKQ
jgi:hypothetical protein